MNNNKYKTIKALAEELDALNTHIEDRLESLRCDYTCTGEEQRTDWQGNLLWEDEEHTVPKMGSKFEYVPKTEYTEEERYSIEALEKIQKYLEKML